MAKGEGIIFRARQEAGEWGRLGEVWGGGGGSGFWHLQWLQLGDEDRQTHLKKGRVASSSLENIVSALL